MVTILYAPNTRVLAESMRDRKITGDMVISIVPEHNGGFTLFYDTRETD